jgi:hypothetical protein
MLTQMMMPERRVVAERVGFRHASLLGLALWLVAPKALAWGDDGHRVVGEIAWHYLTPAAQRVLSESLSDPGYATLADAATWPDTYARRHREYDAMRSFHYVNVPATAQAYRAERDCPHGCVVTALEQMIALLGRRDPPPSAAQQRENIYWIAHLVGDLHQPLHVAHPDGKGGNLTRLSLLGEQEPEIENAHFVWDVVLIDRRPTANGDYRELARSLLGRIQPAQLNFWRRSLAPEAMANESLRVAKRHAFAQDGDQVDEAYVRARWPVVAEQLCKAGVRLAAILERALAAP